MKLLVTKGDASKDEVGGKAKKLLELQNWGFKVPSFVALTTQAHDQYLKNGKLGPELLSILDMTVSTWDSPTLAVRSSMSAEDGASQSYAGMMESYLHVSPKDTAQFVYLCFESVNSDRVQMYDNKNQSSENDQKAAVIVQAMIDSDASGVAFSRSPVQDSSLVRIEAGFGIGEGIVSGTVEVDSYELNRFGEIITKDIAKKETAVRFTPEKDGEKIGIREVSKDLQDKPCLTDGQIKELFNLVLEIEAKFNYPVDIEWAIKDGKLYLLQARPITQSFADIEYYIDTNLSESYPGKIAKSSGEYVALAYETVFNQVFEALSYSDSEIKELKPKLSQLVKNIDGHMYYNLPVYYETLAMLPGGKKNIENWHKMIGGNFENCIETKHFKSPSKVQSMKTVYQIARHFIFHDRIFAKVQKDIQSQAKTFDRLLEDDYDIKKALDFLKIMETQTTGFGEAAINDLLIMISMKGITKIFQKYNIDETYLPGLIKTDEGVNSLKPLQDLDKLVARIKEDDKYFEEFSSIIEAGVKFNEKDPYEKVFSQLSNYPQINLEIKAYLEEHGDRSFEELKLECLTLKQSPKNFLDLIRFKYNSKAMSHESNAQLQELDCSSFSVLDKKALDLCVYYAHKTIAMREQTRLLRGQLYGRARQVLLKAFSSIQDQYDQFSEYSIEDFFHVSLEDYRAYVENKIDIKELKAILDSEIAKDQDIDYPEFFTVSSDVKEPAVQRNSIKVSSFESNKACGLGASSGEVIGEALVLSDPSEAMKIDDLSNKILITKTTDPAWVFIMSQCKGLISEKGSLLSHTAIIGRELGIPTVVGLKGVCNSVEQGASLSINGKTGEVVILEEKNNEN